MARVLGLDLGSHSLKGLILETTLRGYAVKAYAQVPMPVEGEPSERLRAGIQALLQPGQLAGADTVVVALPGVSLAVHPISLPFSDAKKVESTLAGEVESQLPFELEDAVIDHQVARVDDSGTQLLVGVVRKAELAALLERLRAAKVEPRVVTHPALVYQSLLQTMPEAEESVAIVDLGHQRVCVAIGRPGGTVELARSFAGGGAALTRALAQEFQIPLADAASWKETHGALGSEVVGPDAERAAGVFLRALQPVLRELKATFKSHEARTRRPVTRVLLCGGTARLRGMAEQLERDLGVPTQALELPADFREAVGGASQREAAQAVALALRGQATGARASRFNLRKGEFSFKSDLDFMTEKVPQLVAFAAVLVALLIAGSMVRNVMLERREKQVDAQFCDVTTRVLGKCERDPTIALALLKGQESPAAGIPRRSAASLLAELTQHVPPEMKITFDQVVVSLDQLSVRCEATESKDMEDLMAALKQYRCFKEIREGKLEKSKDGSKVSFRLEIQVECPEESSGQQG
jgi:general secretion pathway protein L